MPDGNQMTVEALGQRVAELESRMEAAEGDLRAVLRVAGLPLTRPRPRVSPPPPTPVIPPPLPRVPPSPPPAPVVVDKTPAFPVIITPPKTEPRPSSPSPIAATPRVARPDKHPEPAKPTVSLEARIGKNLAGWVGAIVLVLGVGFFLKYAWQHEWIHPSPTARVVFTVLAGFGLAGVGEWLYRKPMRGLAAVLYGAGVAVVMTAFFAAHAYFSPPVIGQHTAAVMVCLAAAGGIGLALRANLPAMAVLSLLGAYLSPIVLRSGPDQSATLFAYLLLLAATGWVLCAFRPRWAGLRAFTFAASWVWYVLWFMNIGYRGGHTGLALAYVAVVYAGTLAELFITMQRQFKDGPQAVVALGTGLSKMESAGAVLSLVSSLPTAIAFYMLYRTNQPLVGALLIGMAGVQAIVALSTFSRQMRFSAILQATALVTLAVPLMLSQFAINLAWLVMGVALAVMSRRLDLRWARVWATALWLLAVAKLVTIDLLNPSLRGVVTTIGTQPLSRWLLMAWSAAATGHALGFLGRRGVEKDARGAILAACGTLLFLLATGGTWNGGNAGTLAGLLWLTAIVGLHKQGARLGYARHAWALLAVLSTKWLLADGLAATFGAWTSATRDVGPIANLVVLNGLLLCGLLTWMRSMTQSRDGRLLAAVAMGVIAFALANFETCRTINYLGHAWGAHQLTNAKQVALCWLWAGVAMALGTWDTLRPATSPAARKGLRGIAVSLLVIALARVTLFAEDPSMRAALAHLGTHPVSRWLLMMAAMSVAAHVLAWLTADRSERPDPSAGALAGLGTLAYMAAVIGTWGFAPAATLAGIAWLAPIAFLSRHRGRIDYTQHAWALAVALLLKWLIADGLVLAAVAYASPSAEHYLPLINMPTLCAILLASVFYYLGRITDEHVRLAGDATPRLLATAAVIAIGFLLINFESLRAINHFAASQTITDLKIAKQVALSILWAAASLVAISIGFGRRITAARYAGLAVLGITLLKVFTVDMAGVETIWRILSFTAVGALLLCVSFVYYKHLEGKVTVQE